MFVVRFMSTSALTNKAPIVDGTPVEPVKFARDSGFYIDFDLLMRTHV